MVLHGAWHGQAGLDPSLLTQVVQGATPGQGSLGSCCPFLAVEDVMNGKCCLQCPVLPTPSTPTPCRTQKG